MLAKKPPSGDTPDRQSRRRKNFQEAPSRFARSNSISSTCSSTKTADSLCLPKINKKSNKDQLKRSLSTSSGLGKKKTKLDENQLRREKFRSQSLKELDDAAKYARTILKHNYPIRLFDQVPKSSMPPLHIINQAEVKKKFIESQIPPVFQFRVDNESALKIVSKHGQPEFHYFEKAKHILDTVKEKFPSGLSHEYFEANFGERVSNKEVLDIIGDYLKNNRIKSNITINFAPGQTCSGRISTYTISKDEPEKVMLIIFHILFI